MSRSSGLRGLVLQQQRVEIAAESGEGRAEIVGHAGDEVAPGGLGPAQLVDLVTNVGGHGVVGFRQSVNLVARETLSLRRRYRFGEIAPAECLHPLREALQPLADAESDDRRTETEHYIQYG